MVHCSTCNTYCTAALMAMLLLKHHSGTTVYLRLCSSTQSVSQSVITVPFGSDCLHCLADTFQGSKWAFPSPKCRCQGSSPGCSVGKTHALLLIYGPSPCLELSPTLPIKKQEGNLGHEHGDRESNPVLQLFSQAVI